DAKRQRVLMLGGLASFEAWEWDGVDWRRQHWPGEPQGSEIVAAAYDVARGRVLMVSQAGSAYGGYGIGSWLLGDALLAVVTPFGSGCGAAPNPPALAAGAPFVGNRRFVLDVVRASANPPAAITLSLQGQALPIGG